MRELTFDGVTITDVECQEVLAFVNDKTGFIPDCLIVSPVSPRRFCWEQNGRALLDIDLEYIEAFLNEWFTVLRGDLDPGDTYYVLKDVTCPYTATSFLGEGGMYLGVNKDGETQWVSRNAEVYIRVPADGDRMKLKYMALTSKGYFMQDTDTCRVGDRFIALANAGEYRWIALEREGFQPRCVNASVIVKQE